MNRPNILSARPLSCRVAGFAAALALCAGAVAAQPIPARPDIADALIERTIATAKAQLGLNTSQQVAFDNAVGASRAARQAARADLQRVRDTLQAELAKTEPDLAAVAALADQVHQQHRARHLQVRDQWLALYATFSPDQKAVVKDTITQRLARMEELRGRMRARMQGPNG